MPAPATELETFLAALTRVIRKNPWIEGMVFWATADGWDDTPSEMLEAEEIAFYAEGLLLDGFRLHWWLAALADSPDRPDHLRLCFWQDDAAAPDLAPGWVSLGSGRWPAP